jgi:hypothetical protein
MKMSKETASTILSQLGGNMFASMTGAKNFTSHSDNCGALSFFLPSNMTKNNIKHVKITLNGNDLYEVVFTKIRGTKVTQISKFTDVYCDELVNIFEENTGLYTHF